MDMTEEEQLQEALAASIRSFEEEQQTREFLRGLNGQEQRRRVEDARIQEEERRRSEGERWRAEEERRRREEEERRRKDEERRRREEEERRRREEEERRRREEELRVAREQEARRIAREQEARRVEEERRRIAREQEALRIAREQEALRIAHEQEARRVEEERRRIAREQEALRIAQQEALRIAREQEALRIAREQEAKRVEEMGRHREDEPAPHHSEDDEIRRAIAESLALSQSMKHAHDLRARDTMIYSQLPPLPQGMVRDCIELPKNTGKFNPSPPLTSLVPLSLPHSDTICTGGLIVGAGHRHAKQMSATIGDRCSISFLSRRIYTEVGGIVGDCLVIEAGAHSHSRTLLHGELPLLFTL
jgi:hypothetical protein